MSIKDALSEASYNAKIEGRQPPVIYTDRLTAWEIAKELAREIGCSVFELRHRCAGDPADDGICMFDGIIIRELTTYDPKADRQFLSVWKSRLRAAFSRS